MELASLFLLPNGTFFVELAIFLAIVFFMQKKAVPVLNRAMEARQEQIRSSLDAADQAKADAAEADVEKREELERARHQAREIIATANHTAEVLQADSVTRAQTEYDRILGAAEEDVRLARQRAVEEAASRLGELVVDVVEKIIGREVNAEAHRDLIDAAVRSLAEEPVATGAGTGSGASASS